MISVIVPVFQVEPYLEQSINSIIGQTYPDLEILLIDDGSPDKCGEICDKYEAIDSRVRVIHTENRGLSAARNLGIEHAHGEYLSFVDSDDWIEPNMLERLMKVSEESGADIVVCGRVMEYPNKREIISPPPGILKRDEAVKALALLEIRNPAWDKLWKKKCFESIRFPVGRVYEDIATTYRVFLHVEKVACIQEALYHYRIRGDSISHDGRLDHLVDYFKASREEYESITCTMGYSEDSNIRKTLLTRCARVAFRIWSGYLNNSRTERKRYHPEVVEASRFIQMNFTPHSKKCYSRTHRMLFFLCRYPSWWAFAIAKLLVQIKHILNLNKKREIE